MQGDFVPRADQAFHVWQANFHEYLSANAASLGFSAADVAALDDAQSGWAKAIETHVRLHAEAKAAFAAKVAARAAYLALIRPAVRRIQSRTKTTDAERRRLGITVPDAVRSPAPPPRTRPIVDVMMGERLQHRVRLFDEPAQQANPGTGAGSATGRARRARPRRTTGAELFVALTAAGEPPPEDASMFRYVSLVTAGSSVVEFLQPDAGRTAHYIARWISTRGEHGPWSETASATVGA